MSRCDASRTNASSSASTAFHRRVDAVASNEVSESLNVGLGSLREAGRLAHARETALDLSPTNRANSGSKTAFLSNRV
jgi:hypothetical protein